MGLFNFLKKQKVEENISKPLIEVQNQNISKSTMIGTYYILKGLKTELVNPLDNEALKNTDINKLKKMLKPFEAKFLFDKDWKKIMESEIKPENDEDAPICLTHFVVLEPNSYNLRAEKGSFKEIELTLADGSKKIINDVTELESITKRITDSKKLLK